LSARRHALRSFCLRQLNNLAIILHSEVNTSA